MIIPTPYTDFKTWTDNLFIDYPVSFQVTDVSEENWQEVARNIILIPAISVTNPPHPEDYPDWREWASRLIELNF
jgi:hypothetical protein